MTGDLMTLRGAEALRRLIEDYWEARGYAVRTHLVTECRANPHGKTSYHVRSDMGERAPPEGWREMRPLIVGTTYLSSPAKVELLKIWAQLIETHSPECDVLVLDSCSPTPAADHLPAAYSRGGSHRKIHRFSTDIGHPIQSSDPHRDFLFGLQWAVEWASDLGYDYVVHWETDCLMARPVSSIVGRMRRAGVKVAAPFEANQQFIETQLLFFDVAYLKGSRFVERYREAYSPREVLSERCVEDLCKDDLFLLPLRGMRDNFGLLSPQNLRRTFRHGCDWLSHCQDFGVYVEFLKMNGV